MEYPCHYHKALLSKEGASMSDFERVVVKPD